MQSCSYFLQVEFISAGPVQKICTFIFSSIHAQEWSFLQPLLGTQDGHDVASYLSWLPLAFITTDAWGMTHGMLVSVQHGLNVGMCGLSQNKLLMRVIKRLPILCFLYSQNYFLRLPKLFINFTSPRFRCNSKVLCITSASMSEIAGNPDLLWVKLEWNSLD